jgi:16S rRNA (guanine527-N7)-methyltransferase
MPGATWSSTPPEHPRTDPGPGAVTADPDLEALPAVFAAAQRSGFLGPRPVAEQINHAVAFAGLLGAAGVGPADFLDLGSGGGIPGLVLAAVWPGRSGTLLDASQRRTAFLRRTIAGLGWESRISVLEGQAETLARDPGLRSSFVLVVSRSFAAPSVTAEIGGALLEVGGYLAVSEPIDDADRWPSEGLAGLGLEPVQRSGMDTARIAVIRRATPVDDRWPRGPGVPTKRPLW